jgi:hypothetical protein
MDEVIRSTVLTQNNDSYFFGPGCPDLIQLPKPEKRFEAADI